MNYLKDIASLYSQIIEEGIEEKIPKLLNLVRPDIEDKETYIRWAAETFDPSKNAAYITWILRMLKKGVIAGEEDAQKVQERLAQFEELKKKPQFPKDKRDINAYKTYGDLAETLDQFQGVKTKGEMKREAQEEGIQFVGSSGGREGAGVSLYIVTSSEAASKHFRSTDWCVKDPRYFDNYSPPYYFFTENGQPKTLLHLNSNQCMDVRDRPTNLDEEEKELMELEEVTNYVLANDNSDSALAFYSQKVGGGYDGKIHEIFWGKLEELIDGANKNLKMFTISEPYSDELEYYTPEALGSIPYNLTPYEDYIGDKDFLKAVKDVLYKVNIYVSDDWIYSDNQFSEDLDSINLDMRHEDDGYRSDSITNRMESFISELEGIERDFDAQEFDEAFREIMLNKGYISSGWGDFINKVSVNNLEFINFGKPSYDNTYSTTEIAISDDTHPNSPSFDIKDVENLLTKYTRQSHPYILLAEFLKPFIQRGLVASISRGAQSMIFRYQPKMVEGRTGKQYIKGLKAVKDFDTHYDFYIEQIRKFCDKYVFPYLRKSEDGSENSFGIPENIKLPYIQIKSRKESGDQGMLDLHERKTFSKYFELFIEKYNELKIHNSITRLPMNKPYGFWMDRHGNFVIVTGGMGEHERMGELILNDMGVPAGRSVYDTLFKHGWVRIVLVRGKTFYETGISQRLVPIQKRNLSFINDLYDLGGVEEG